MMGTDFPAGGRRIQCRALTPCQQPEVISVEDCAEVTGRGGATGFPSFCLQAAAAWQSAGVDVCDKRR